MNEKLQYASMLEIPVNTCNISYKPIRKKRTKSVSDDSIKKQVIEKVNSQTKTAEPVLKTPETNNTKPTNKLMSNVKHFFSNMKISVVGAELIVIGVLVAVILLTSTINKNSAINVFFRETFSSGKQITATTDDRLYSEFAPVLSKIGNDAPVIEDGVLTVSGTGSIYSVCDGEVCSVAIDGNGKYTLEVKHSDNFKSVLKGLDYAYAETGDKVYSNIPVGYVSDSEVSMCFFGSENQAITDFSVEEDAIVWQIEDELNSTVSKTDNTALKKA